MPNPQTIDSVAAEMFDAIRGDAGHFPDYIKSRGRTYVSEGRVGPLVVESRRISATVRGTQRYQTSWFWDGRRAHPRCTCPAGPVCKHAYALARAIDSARNGAHESARITARSQRREDGHRQPFRGDDFRSPERVNTAAEDLADELARRAHRHAGMPPLALRGALGIARDESDRPMVWIEVRLVGPGSAEAPCTERQILQLSAELKRDALTLGPPHARLLRFVAAALPRATRLRTATRVGLTASLVNRLLDSFSDSSLVTWSGTDAEAAHDHGGITPGARLRLGNAAVDIVPMPSGEAADMRIVLAARWPDGRRRPLDEMIYLRSDDDLHPSLVLAEGAFWRVAEEPPAHLLRPIGIPGGLPVPEHGRARFLQLLAASFGSVADAFAPHVRFHRARPVVALDLHEDDWMELQLFATTGDDAWRPGQPTGSVSFQLDSDGQWVRHEPERSETATERFMVGRIDGSAAAMSEDAAPERAEPGAPSSAWIDMPEVALVAPVREWLATLPLVPPSGARAAAAAATPGVPRGAWMHLSARHLEAFAQAWDRRPPDVLYLGNARLRQLLDGSHAIRARVTIVSSGIDWFTVSAEWRSEGQALSEEDIARLRAARTRFVKLSTGWVRREALEAADAMADRLADLGIEVGAGEQRVAIAPLARAAPESLAVLAELGADARTTSAVERVRAMVRDFAGVPRIPVPQGVHANLREYQRDGLDFLAFLTDLGLGAVLADDMGLGKTLQALAWVEWMRERDPAGGPALVVCPASVVSNWQREAERFTPGLRVLALTSGEERHVLRREVPDHDLVITNYALLRRDLERWRAIPLRAAILDEAQFVKNPSAAVSRAVCELNARHRLALTGTPIENRALDLWSIMQFVNPGYLGRRTAFAAQYDRPDRPPYVRRLLAARLRPVLLRRLKEQVATDLPDRIEERRECTLTPGQRRLYLAELMHGRATLERLKGSAAGVLGHRIEILAAITRLRQVCCHPALVGGRDALKSGKFEALFEVLEPLLAEGRKVLVFSQFVECLKLLAADMTARGLRHHMLTGATTRRAQVVEAFESDPEPCVFLISLKAGGTGLNLTAASYVVLFDPWWNPAVEAQAIDRAHRIGQTRTVIAYRMLTAGTIEERIWELQQRKAALAAEMLDEGGFARTLTSEDFDYLLA